MKKVILDLCGGTGSWSKPYKEAGYDVRLVTLPDKDVREYVTYPENVYGILAAPPCTQFSFARTNAKTERNLYEGLEIVKACLRIIWECQYNLEKPYAKKTKLKFWVLENPNGFLKYFLGKPALEFHPWEYGDSYKKRTHVWGYFNNPVKNPVPCNAPKFDQLKTKDIHREYYGKLTRQERRAITPKGFAKAFYEVNK